jgi:hypothetical protein
LNRVYLKQFIITSIITSLAACSLFAYSSYDYTTSTNTRYKIVNQENKVPPKIITKIIKNQTLRLMPKLELLTNRMEKNETRNFIW